jgi:hypothetical protein
MIVLEVELFDVFASHCFDYCFVLAGEVNFGVQEAQFCALSSAALHKEGVVFVTL